MWLFQVAFVWFATTHHGFRSSIEEDPIGSKVCHRKDAAAFRVTSPILRCSTYDIIANLQFHPWRMI